MEHQAAENDDDQLRRDRMELHQAVGLEARESTSRHAGGARPDGGETVGDQSATTAP